ncbi:MAG: glucose 1-dehydrogenase [Chloroflexi bacterium]|nr:glucose 1-dehydrogenase [Chloroflexota bacterium]
MSSISFDLSGKTAIVTGGNGGIGLGIARGLAQAGANVVVAARNQQKTDSALKELRSLGVKAIGVSTEVTNEEDVADMVKAALDEFGRVDILVNNAGMSIRKAPQDYTMEEFERVIDVNLNGTFLCSRDVHAPMKEAGGGKIINIGSMTSVFGSDWVAPYSASKGAVVQLTKSLAIAWASDNIQVNAILPGWIHTDLTAPIKTDFSERYETIRSRIPHGRWGEPEEMGGCAVFLASTASDYVTGVSIPVDGGYVAF